MIQTNYRQRINDYQNKLLNKQSSGHFSHSRLFDRTQLQPLNKQNVNLNVVVSVKPKVNQQANDSILKQLRIRKRRMMSSKHLSSDIPIFQSNRGGPTPQIEETEKNVYLRSSYAQSQRRLKNISIDLPQHLIKQPSSITSKSQLPKGQNLTSINNHLNFKLQGWVSNKSSLNSFDANNESLDSNRYLVSKLAQPIQASIVSSPTMNCFNNGYLRKLKRQIEKL